MARSDGSKICEYNVLRLGVKKVEDWVGGSTDGTLDPGGGLQFIIEISIRKQSGAVSAFWGSRHQRPSSFQRPGHKRLCSGLAQVLDVLRMHVAPHPPERERDSKQPWLTSHAHLMLESLSCRKARGPPGPPPGSKMSSEPPRPAAAPKFGHLIVKCVKGIELKVGVRSSRFARLVRPSFGLRLLL